SLGGVAGEDDLLRRGRVDEAANAFARILKGLGRGVGKIMEAAMNVGVFLGVTPGDRVDHRLRLLGRCGVVEIDERLAIDLARQDWEIAADQFDVVGGGPAWPIVRAGGNGDRLCGHAPPLLWVASQFPAKLE